MRSVIRAAVEDGAVSCCHLDHRAGIVLSERVGRQIDLAHIFFRIQDAGGFTGKIDACRPSESEEILIAAEHGLAHFLCKLHHDIVAGFSECSHKIQFMMCMRAADIAVHDLFTAVAVIYTVAFGEIFLKGRGRGDHLGRRPRFEAVGDGEIPPHPVPRVRLLTVAHCADLSFCIHVCEIIRIIQVKYIIRRQCQNLRISGIHDKHGDILRCIFLHEIRDGVLDDPLDRIIDRSDDRRAVHRLLCCAVNGSVRVHIAVAAAVRARKDIVVILLQSPVSLRAVRTGKAHDRAGKGIIGVDPAVFRLEPHPGDLAGSLLIIIVLCLIGFKSLAPVIRHLFLITEIGTGGVFTDRFLHFFPGITEYVDQRLDRGLDIILVPLVDHRRIQDQVIDLLAGRQYRLVPVHDGAPLERDHRGAVALLGKDDLAVIFSFPQDQADHDPYKHK